MTEQEVDVSQLLGALNSSGKDVVSAKDHIIELANKSEISDELKKTYWHFTSNTLSSSFFDVNEDKASFLRTYWILFHLALKKKKANQVNKTDMLDLLQLKEHAKTRFNQSVGTQLKTKTNVISMMLKDHKVQEISTNDNGQVNKR